MTTVVTATLTAENTFSDWIKPLDQLSYGINGVGFLDLAINGTWAGTLTVQKRHFHGSTPTYTDAYDVVEYTANAVKLIEDHSNTVEYRVGFKTGNFTSGSASIRLEK